MCRIACIFTYFRQLYFTLLYSFRRLTASAPTTPPRVRTVSRSAHTWAQYRTGGVHLALAGSPRACGCSYRATPMRVAPPGLVSSPHASSRLSPGTRRRLRAVPPAFAAPSLRPHPSATPCSRLPSRRLRRGVCSAASRHSYCPATVLSTVIGPTSMVVRSGTRHAPPRLAYCTPVARGRRRAVSE